VVDIRQIHYSSVDVTVKLRHTDNETSALPSRPLVKKAVQLENIPQLYTSTIPIKKKIFLDLQELKVVIDKTYHSYYDNLKHD